MARVLRRSNGHGFSRVDRDAMMPQLVRLLRGGPRRLQPRVRRVSRSAVTEEYS